DESGFEAGFNAGDSSFIDVRLFLFTSAGFNVQIVQALSIDECDTQLFGLSCVNKHSFHVSLGYPAQGHEADYRGKTVAGQNPAAITVDSVQCRTHARVLKLQQLARLSVRKRSENFVWQVVIP